MYYIIYPILYLISLLPFFIIYGLSNFIAFVLYNLAGYRKEVVLNNLQIAFPEKTLAERKKIAKKFYRNLIDTFLESIKLLSLSDKELNKRAKIDLSSCQEIIASGKNIQFHCGHQMNWEYGNLAIAEALTIPWAGVYMKISNKALDKIFYDLRGKRGTILVGSREFKSKMHSVFQNQYTLGLAADQKPGIPTKGSWMYFFTKATPFVNGPDKGARLPNTAVVFVNFVKSKRGFYEFVPTVIESWGVEFEPNEVSLRYRDFLEESIRSHPDNYLWTHKRWKYDWKPEYAKLWIDNSPMPVDSSGIKKVD